MRTHNITKEQSTYNRVCQQLDFTEKNGNSGRYVVGVENLYTGVNPSRYGYTLQAKIHLAIRSGKAVGGWMDTNTGTYYVDVVAMTDEKHVAQTLGHENAELCIWDSQEEKTIDIYGKSLTQAELETFYVDKYPYQNGDGYWYEMGDEIVFAYWDIASECSHDRNPFQKYYTLSEVVEIAKKSSIKIIK